MAHRWHLLLIALLISAKTLAQTPPGAPTADSLRLTRLMPFKQAGAASADPGGMLYVADALQNIVQLGPDGQRRLTYSAPVRGRVAALDAGFTGKVLAFYDDRQALTLFDRFLSPITALQFADYPATAERLIAFERGKFPQGNRIFWLENAIRRWERDNQHPERKP